jgi:hypothetical protein
MTDTGTCPYCGSRSVIETQRDPACGPDSLPNTFGAWTECEECGREWPTPETATDPEQPTK